YYKTSIFENCILDDSVCVPCLNNTSQISVNGKCFKVFKNNTNWNGAQGFCSKNFYNGKLAEPITQNELNAIYKLVDVVRNGAFNVITWIGANDLEVEGHFVWASDNSTLNPALWGKSAPDNWLNPYTNERENCVSLVVNENLTRLNDASCSLNYSLICQS
ncbi:C-type lectin 4, partial [Biomphalaria pfeifferi]